MRSPDEVQRRRVLAVGIAYFLVQILIMYLFQLRWSSDVAIFGSFWEAGKHLDYDLHPLVWTTRDGFTELNLNSPALFPLFQLFAFLEPQAGQSIWLFVSASIYLGLVVWFSSRISLLQLLWLFTAPMVYAGIGLGQIYVLMFALGAGIWWCLRSGRTLFAAVLVGVLVAMKPNFAIWGLVAFAAGHFRAAVIAGVVAFALSLLPAALYGPEIYIEWFAAASLDDHGAFPHDVSLFGYFNRLGIPGAGVGIAAVLLVVLGWAWRFRATLYDLTPVAILAAMLCSPLAWIDYLLVCLPFIVDRPWKLSMLFAVLLTYLSGFAGEAVNSGRAIIFVASTICLAPVLIMLVEFLRRGAAPNYAHAAGSPAPSPSPQPG